MKEVTSPARRKWSFPIPVDVQTGTGGDQEQDKDDERALHDALGSRKEEVESRK
jgi:hypothetical protein